MIGHSIPAEKLRLAEEIASRLCRVSGVVAVALGGSPARGTRHAQSDLDIGLYYREAAPFAIDEIRLLARDLDAAGAPTVAGLGEWGPWMNGGAWIQASVCKVDLLFRSLDLLERTARDAKAGLCSHDYHQQPPFGLGSLTCLAEIECCAPLHDEAGELQRLKAAIATYPPALAERVTADSLWAAEFSLLFAADFARRGDIPSTVGCLTRCFHSLVQALFALNRRYFTGDKGALAAIEGFAKRPDGFAEVVNRVLAGPGDNSAKLTASVEQLKGLFRATAALAVGYRPRFSVPGA
ncbi:MAG: DUF4037 domain-containing protein [Myxococcales bacterium]